MKTLKKFIKQVGNIVQERKVEVVTHITPHGNFIEVILANGYKHSFDYDLEVKANKGFGLNLSNVDFVNDLIDQVVDGNS